MQEQDDFHLPLFSTFFICSFNKISYDFIKPLSPAGCWGIKEVPELQGQNRIPARLHVSYASSSSPRVEMSQLLRTTYNFPHTDLFIHVFFIFIQLEYLFVYDDHFLFCCYLPSVKCPTPSFWQTFLRYRKATVRSHKDTTILQAVFHHLKLNFLDSKIPACLQRCCGILCQSLAKIKANYIHSSHFIHKSNFSIIKDNQVVQAFIIV